MLELALCDQVLHGAGNILNRYRRIDAVLIEEFNSIKPQPRQRLLGYLSDALGPAIGRTRSAGAKVEAKFGGDDDALLHGRQSFPYKLLVREWTVDLGGVEERDAALDRGAEQRDHLVSVRSRATVIIHAHATE